MAILQLPILTLEGIGQVPITAVSEFTIGGLEADVFLDTVGNVYETVMQVPSVFVCEGIYDVEVFDIEAFLQFRRGLADIEYQTAGVTWRMPRASVTGQSSITLNSETGRFSATLKGKKGLKV